MLEEINGSAQQINAVEEENYCEDDFLRNSYKQEKIEAMEFFREQLGSKLVFTGVWIGNADEYEVEENGLLQGELSAVVFQVGCYTVRSAMRVYKTRTRYSPELEMPADKADVDLVKKREQVVTPVGGAIDMEFEMYKLRVTHEISARHNSASDNTFTVICRAVHNGMLGRIEDIGYIFAAKEQELFPDEYASLFVYRTCHAITSSFGVDTWYRLEPTGKITKLETDNDGIIPDGACFKPL